MEKKTYTYDYPMASVTADMGVLRRAEDGRFEILLIKRKNEPYKDCWALPGGFMEMNETLEKCAIRELKEETGIEVERAEFIDLLDAVERDPRGRVISAVFKSYVPEGTIAVANDDAIEIGWFKNGQLPPLAFDHKWAITKIFMTIWE
jgi:8-oxo-dGTP diphosphatase